VSLIDDPSWARRARWRRPVWAPPPSHS